MSSFASRFGNLTVEQVLELNAAARRTCEFEEIEDSGAWEPRQNETYYYLENEGTVRNTLWVRLCNLDKNRYVIGNCFETEEKAKEAIERLKALKRLRDLGLKFRGSRLDGESMQDKYWHVTIAAAIKPFNASDENIVNDFDLLFEETDDE